MPKFKGQTDKVLKVQMKSSLLSAGWGLAAVSMGGKIPIEVETLFVADGSDIKVTVKDLEGGVVETLEGKVLSGYYRAIFPLTKPNKTGGMYFEAELAAHHLKAVGPKLRVLPPVQITDLKWADGSGAAITEAKAGQRVELSAKVAGPPDGTEAYISIRCRKEGHREADMGSFTVGLKDGKAVVKCAVKPPDAGPEPWSFSFEAGCLGTTAKSAEIPVKPDERG